jgi:hypothetical protein
MHSGLLITFIKLCKFQDHLESVMPSLEVVRIPALWLRAEIAYTRLLWHSSLLKRWAFARPLHFAFVEIRKFLNFK